jgi:membrane associated rhomboid family serine protease
MPSLDGINFPEKPIVTSLFWMHLFQWPFSAFCTFVFAGLLVATTVGLESWFQYFWEKEQQKQAAEDPFGPWMANLIRKTPFGTLMDAGIEKVRDLARRSFLSQMRALMIFDPIAVRRGEFWRFFTAPFVTTHPIELLISLIGLFFIGANFESSLSRIRSILCSIALTVVPHLLSLALSCIDYRDKVYGPCYFIIGLAICYGHCEPKAVISILGVGVSIRWIPYIWALGVLLYEKAMFTAVVTGVVGGWITAHMLAPKVPGVTIGDPFGGEGRRFEQQTPIHRFEQPAATYRWEDLQEVDDETVFVPFPQ